MTKNSTDWLAVKKALSAADPDDDFKMRDALRELERLDKNPLILLSAALHFFTDLPKAWRLQAMRSLIVRGLPRSAKRRIRNFLAETLPAINKERGHYGGGK